MLTKTGPLTGYDRTVDLVGPMDARPYLFLEHELSPGHASPFRLHPADYRTFIVLEGQVELQCLGENGDLVSAGFGRFAGWHAIPSCVYRVVNTGERPALLLEAGTTYGETREAADSLPLRRGAAVHACPEVSGYTVDKPWGHEVWYTRNVPGMEYAVKQIHMTLGHQSSLQSHRYKRETNYVVEGEATVLDGLMAPDDTDAAVDPARLTSTVHGPRSGWSSPPGMLHRVIARSDYTSIEVSTPELDDVIRWQDDTGRAHGRIDAEHERAGGHR